MAQENFVVGKGLTVDGGNGPASPVTTTVNTSSEVEIYSFNPGDFSYADLTVNITQGSKTNTIKANVAHDGTDVSLSTYSITQGATAVANTTPVKLSASYNERGRVWTTLSNTQMAWTTNNLILGAAYGNGAWVVVGQDTNSNTGVARHSTDLVTWTTITTSVSNIYKSVAFGGGQFVLLTDSHYVFSSTDGITWVSRGQHGVNGGFAGEVTYGDNQWVLVGHGNTVRRSTDAITWVTSTGPFNAFTHLKFVTYAQDKWVMGGGYGRIATSTDAVTWTTRTSNLHNAQNFYAHQAAYKSGRWVVITRADITYPSYYATSTDAITWTTSLFGYYGYMIAGDIAASEEKFMMSNSNGNALESTDGLNWKIQYRVHHGSSYEQDWRTIALGNDTWFVGTRGGVALYSSDIPSVSISATIADASSSSAIVTVQPNLYSS